MYIHRRRFVQLGAMTVLANAAGCGCPKTLRMHVVSVVPSGLPTLPPNTLGIDFEGLYLLEEKGSAMAVHLVDAHEIGMSPHRAQLRAFKSTIDDTQTMRPQHVEPYGNDEIWVWDLDQRQVTTPRSDSGDDDLTPLGNSTEDTAEIPTTEDGWNSRARIADLRLCCGATKITEKSAIASTVNLTHGRVDVLNPGDPASRAVWQFTGPHDQVLMRRALSDKVRYSCPTAGQQLVIRVGEVPIVFKSGGGLARAINTPLKVGNKCRGCDLKMDHFRMFFKMVDKQMTPDICLYRFTLPPGEDVLPDYCPGGRISWP